MKKYRYIMVIAVIIIIGIILFTNSKKDVKIEINKLAKEIIKNVNFEDEMNETDNGTIEKLYNINNAVSQKVYISSGATAEEIAIFEFENKNEVNDAFEKANNRIEEQKESFKNYAPKEMKKLEEALIIKKGRFLIVCVTEDNNVENIIEKYLK